MIIVGRQDTGDLEAQIRGSRHAWDVRLISVDALLRLLKVRDSVDDPSIATKISQILIPREYTGVMAGSVSLQADALDFLGDVANYGISLFVIGTALRYRAKAALIKGATMGLFGLWVSGAVVWHAFYRTLPHAVTMSEVGLAALVANVVVFGLLWTSRKGDSNMRSAWLCSRNDVIGNLAVLIAAAGVFGTGTGWPDVIVAAIMGALDCRAQRRSSGMRFKSYAPHL